MAFSMLTAFFARPLSLTIRSFNENFDSGSTSHLQPGFNTWSAYRIHLLARLCKDSELALNSNCWKQISQSDLLHFSPMTTGQAPCQDDWSISEDFIMLNQNTAEPLTGDAATRPCINDVSPPLITSESCNKQQRFVVVCVLGFYNC